MNLNHFKQQRRLHPRFPHAYYAITKRSFPNIQAFDFFGPGEFVIYVVAENLFSKGSYNVLIMDREQKRCNCVKFEELKDALNIANVAEPVTGGGLKVMHEYHILYAKKIAHDKLING